MTKDDQPRRAPNYVWWLLVGLTAAAIGALVVVSTRRTEPSERPLDLSASARLAEAYLRGRGTKIEPVMLLVLDYLDRRFGLPWVRPEVARVRTLGSSCPQTAETPPACDGSHAIRAFLRLIEPTARLTSAEIAALPNTTDPFTASALYCKANGLPATFLQEVDRQLAGENYDPPHAALGLQWALEQGCLDAQASEVLALRQRVQGALVELAQGVPKDAAIESIALLAYSGGWTRVQPEWVQTIARAQHQEGGWGETENAPPNDHTTTLALWVLLEATRQGNTVAWVPQ